MKTKHALIIFALSIGLTILGALIKILHLPGANVILIIGMSSQFIGIVLLIIKIISNPKFKDFLNS